MTWDPKASDGNYLPLSNDNRTVRKKQKTNPADKWKECWFGVVGAMPCETASVRIESDDHSNTDFLIDLAVPIGWL